jgi:hypothetical protein
VKLRWRVDVDQHGNKSEPELQYFDEFLEGWFLVDTKYIQVNVQETIKQEREDDKPFRGAYKSREQK